MTTPSHGGAERSRAAAADVWNAFFADRAAAARAETEAAHRGPGDAHETEGETQGPEGEVQEIPVADEPAAAPRPAPVVEHVETQPPEDAGRGSEVVGQARSPRHLAADQSLDEQIADLQQYFADQTEPVTAPDKPRHGRSRRPRKPAERTPRTPASTVATALPPVPRRVEFTPRRATHRLLTTLVLAALVAAGIAGWLAWRTGAQSDIVVAGLFAGLALMLMSIRATIQPTHLVIDAGQLTVSRGRSTEVHDLTSIYSRITLTGDPASKNWEITLGRPETGLSVINHDIVDGPEFVRVVEYWRPTLRSAAPQR